MAQIAEVDWLSPGMGDPHPASKPQLREGATWTVPLSALGGRDPRRLVLYRSREDVVGIRRGDVLMLDTNSQMPSPPGIFVWWDGIAASIARFAHVPGENSERGGRVRVEGGGGSYEITVSALPHMLGRVVGRWGPL